MKNKKSIVILIGMLIFTVLFINNITGTTPQSQRDGDISAKMLESTMWVANWTSFGLQDKPVVTLATTEHYLYAGTNGDGVFRKDLISPDSQWEYLGFEDEYVKSIYIDPIFPTIIYVGLYVHELLDEDGNPHSMFKSTDGGLTWNPCDNGIEMEEYPGEVYRLPIYCINGVLGNPYLLYATSIQQILKSVDGGQTWDIIYGNVLGGYGMHVIKIDSSDPQRLWTGGETNIFSAIIKKSIDSGQTWETLHPYLGGDNSCYTLEIHPQDPNVVYAGLEGYVAKTTDGGSNWTFIHSPSDYPYFKGLVLDALHPDHIFAGGAPNCGSYPLKVWGTGDGGQTWQSSSVSVDDGGGKVSSLVLDRIDHNVIYAGTLGGGVWKCVSIWTRPVAHID